MTQRDDLVSRPWRLALDAVRKTGDAQAYINAVDAMCEQAATALEAKDAEIARLREGCAFGGLPCERLTGMAWAHTKSEAELRDALDRIAELERQLAEKNGGRDAG